MKKQLQQPNMDEWLLDPMHGLNEGDEQNIHHHFKRSDFLNALTFQYVCAMRSNLTPYKLEKQIKRVISSSIWPRIVVMRCRLLIESALPLIADGHWELIDETINQTRLILRYLGFMMHGVRLLIDLAVSLETLLSEEFALEGIQQHVAHTWFELCNDAIWIISATTPSDYLAVSCLLMVLELGLIAIRAWIEINRLSSFNAAFGNELEGSALDSDEAVELSLLKTHAEAMLTHTYKRFILNFSVTLTTTAIFFLKAVIVPSVSMTLAINPVVPFIFAALALSISLISHFISQHIGGDKPKIKIEDLPTVQTSLFSQNTFFEIKPSDPTRVSVQSVFVP